MQEIFEKFGTPQAIDDLSLDVVSTQQLSFRAGYRFNVMTVERPNPTLRRLLGRQGYVLLKELNSWGETL